MKQNVLCLIYYITLILLYYFTILYIFFILWVVYTLEISINHIVQINKTVTYLICDCVCVAMTAAVLSYLWGLDGGLILDHLQRALDPGVPVRVTSGRAVEVKDHQLLGVSCQLEEGLQAAYWLVTGPLSLLHSQRAGRTKRIVLQRAIINRQLIRWCKRRYNRSIHSCTQLQVLRCTWVIKQNTMVSVLLLLYQLFKNLPPAQMNSRFTSCFYYFCNKSCAHCSFLHRFVCVFSFEIVTIIKAQQCVWCFISAWWKLSISWTWNHREDLTHLLELGKWSSDFISDSSHLMRLSSTSFTSCLHIICSSSHPHLHTTPPPLWHHNIVSSLFIDLH